MNVCTMYMHVDGEKMSVYRLYDSNKMCDENSIDI